MSKVVKLTRKELYELVWTTSIVKLAKQFRMSDIGLTKICKKYDIPKPGVGYWAKREHGKQVEKKPLPNHHINPEITIDVSGKYQETFRSDAMKSEVVARLKEQFKVPDTLNNPHPLIQQTRKIRKENKDTYYKHLNVLDIDVHPSDFQRALRLMDAFIKVIEKRRHAVTVRKDGSREYVTVVVVKKKEVPIRIYHNCGKLTFGLAGYVDGRKNWADTKVSPLENKLYAITRRIFQIAKQNLERSIQLRIRQRELDRLEAIQAEEERLRQEELKKIQRLENWVTRWKKSQDIKAFVEFARKYVTEKYNGYDEDSEFGQWMNWASDYAEQIQPFQTNGSLA